jgi:outer membrane protein assembly factor BamC
MIGAAPPAMPQHRNRPDPVLPVHHMTLQRDTDPSTSPALPTVFAHPLRGYTALAVALALGGCSTVSGWLGSSTGESAGSPVNYRSKAVKTPPLEVPPDLTQLAREGRFAVQSGLPISASTFGQPSAASGASSAVPAVTPAQVGSVRLERDGPDRRLVTTLAPEVVYERVVAFWKESGFNLEVELPEAGVVETGWAENRAKLPQDPLRSVLGRFADGIFSTGERDRFRTRIERLAGGRGTELTVTHRGLVEAPLNNNKDQITWQGRPSDTALEAEMLYRLMARLGAPEAAVAQARSGDRSVADAGVRANQPVRARLLPDGRLQIDEGFERAWRAVGAGLDRGGFTVEDRDRAGGIYFIRYIDRKAGGQGWMDRMVDVFRSEDSKTRLARYRLMVKGDSNTQSSLTVLNANGQPETSDTVKAIRETLLKELR